MELCVEGLGKRFDRVVAVEAVDFRVPDGELLALLGPSGCGKTTTLRMIAGLERPSAGRITIGQDVMFDAATAREVPAEDRRIGMVFQSYAVWPHLTVFENVAFPLRVRRVATAEMRDRVDEALRIVRLDALASRYPAALSGGQQQRVALARAIVAAPRLLLLDEPLSNLDATLREEMRLEIRGVQQRLGITTLLVTHDQAEALALADRVAVMNAGRIEQIGSPREIYEQPTSPFVAEFVGWKNALEGRVSGRNAVRIGEVEIAGLADLTAPPGAAVTVVCRPEDTEIVGPGVGLPGIVRASLYRATHAVLEVTVANAALIVHAAADVRHRPHDAVGVQLRPERLRVFAHA